MDPPKFRTVLLFPPHVSPNPTTLPLLTALQSLLNVSYTATYCTRPDMFGTEHLRLPDPAQFADLIGADGFTVVIFGAKSDQRQNATESSHRDDGVDRKGDDGLGELVATGSVKAVDDEDVRMRAQQRAPCAESAARERNDAGSNSVDTASEELDEKLQALYYERLDPPRVHELRAFAVSPAHQGLGLGARVLSTIEWLLSGDGAGVLEIARGAGASSYLGAPLSSSLQMGKGGQVQGVDLNDVINLFDQTRNLGVSAGLKEKLLEKDAVNSVEISSSCPWGNRKLVLVAVRELGNEDYYRRRGYKSLRTSILPSGTWGNHVECTTVYMEKVI